jgi:hypothetical protein
VKYARRDLCGGCPAMGIPTAIGLLIASTPSASPDIKRLPGSEEQQYQKLRQHKVIIQNHIYSFSFIAERRVAFDPPVNLPADLGDQKAVPAHANET